MANQIVTVSADLETVIANGLEYGETITVTNNATVTMTQTNTTLIGSITVESGSNFNIAASGDSITLLTGGGLSASQAVQLDELYKLQGLDATNPMTVTRSSRIVGDIDLAITGDGLSTTTVTRTVITNFVVDEAGNNVVDEFGNQIVGIE